MICIHASCAKVARTEQFPELHANYYFYKLSILQIHDVILVRKDFGMESLLVLKLFDITENTKIFHIALICK
jgi:hypothetical protein